MDKVAADSQKHRADPTKRDPKKANKSVVGFAKAHAKLSQEEIDLDEELTDKTIRSGDKIKVARVIADMLGVENAESMSPEMAVNQGLRKMKTKRMTPELIGVVKKMLALAQEVGIKVDMTLVPKAVTEARDDLVVDPSSQRNIATDIMRFKDYTKALKMNRGIVPDEENPDVPPPVGHTLHNDPTQHGTRRMKVQYKTEEVHVSADYKTDRKGRKYPAHRIEISTDKGDVYEEAQPDDEFDLSDDELEKMASTVDHEDDLIDVYDDDELAVVDDETGEEVSDKALKEEALNEVLSRLERMKAHVRFLRTQSKRSMKLKVALKRHSDAKTINKRARRLAVNMLKQRLAKKPIAQMSVPEKERVEAIIQRRRQLIDRLAMKLAPRVRRVEQDRLAHHTYTK